MSEQPADPDPGPSPSRGPVVAGVCVGAVVEAAAFVAEVPIVGGFVLACGFALGTWALLARRRAQRGPAGPDTPAS